jgi:hypothetical protein
MGMPAEGPRCIPLTLDFTLSLAYDLDYSNMQSRNFISMVQTIWVDNSLNAAVLEVTMVGTNQVIKVPAGIQRYYTVLQPNPIKMSFASTGAVVCQVILMNFPVHIQ